MVFLADGAVQPDAVVSSGAAALKYRASKIHAGLSYSSHYAPFRQDVGGDNGTSSGKKKTITNVFIRVWRSLGMRVGSTLDTLNTVHTRTGADPMGVAPPLITDDRRVCVRSGWSWNNDVYIAQSQPLPLKVLGIYPEIEVTRG